MGADGFLGGEVVDVGAGDAEAAAGAGPADGAGAGRGDGEEGGGVAAVAEVEGAVGGYGVAEALWGRGVRGLIFGGCGGRERERGGKGEGKGEKGKRAHTAVRVGQTQSNMSAPKATETTRSSG